ncbi:MAG: histidinol phosphate phosphatase domain-containing protein [Euryarchaeota archaeon]|nr:histidinol phosphate phosphatase domain-containing protein [Euryarchaeota archaeon]
MRIDLHTHTLLSDGALLPIELARRASAMKYEALAFTDHASAGNIKRIIHESKKDAELAAEWDIEVLVGCEITHVPVTKIDEVVSTARKLGAEIIVVHGETISEPVEKGTNRVATNNPDVDILAHPGLITEEDVQAAADNGVLLEITSRPSHCMTNGHVASLARRIGAKLVVNSDAHSPSDLITDERARAVAAGAGMNQEEIELAVARNPREIVRRIRG